MLARVLFQKSCQSLLDLLFPPSCVNCHASQAWLCQNCLNHISFITTTAVCRRCGTPLAGGELSVCVACQRHPLAALDGLRVASYFEDSPIRPAIHFLKYHNHKAVAAVLGKMLADTYRRHQLAADIIVPVPLHSSRLRERGYNQSELLARELATLLDLSVNTSTLYRIRATPSQTKLTATERQANVADAFSCRNHELAGQKVLLLDDVYTTGATLDACAVALKTSGVTTVWGLTLAKGR